MGLRDSNWMLLVRLAQAIFGIIVLGLTAYGLFPARPLRSYEQSF